MHQLILLLHDDDLRRLCLCLLHRSRKNLLRFCLISFRHLNNLGRNRLRLLRRSRDLLSRDFLHSYRNRSCCFLLSFLNHGFRERLFLSRNRLRRRNLFQASGLILCIRNGYSPGFLFLRGSKHLLYRPFLSPVPGGA